MKPDVKPDVKTDPSRDVALSDDAAAALARGEPIAAEVPAKTAGHRRFVIARPFKDGWPNDPEYRGRPWRYRVFAYEVKAALVDEHLSKDMLKGFEEAVVDDAAKLPATLKKWAPPAQFKSNRDVLAPF